MWYRSQQTQQLITTALPINLEPQKQKKFRQWFVPPEVAIVMVELAERYCKTGFFIKSVLEPTCGAGMLLAAAAGLNRWRGRLVGLDVQPQPNWELLCELSPFLRFYDVSDMEQGSLSVSYDWFDKQPMLPTWFDVVLMHPPFGRGFSGSDKGTGFTRQMVLWARNQPHLRGIFDRDVFSVFMGHFLQFVRPGGVMVALTPNTWWTGSSYEPMRRWLLDPRNGRMMVAGVDMHGVKLWSDAAVDCVITVIMHGRIGDEDRILFVDARKQNLENLPDCVYLALDQSSVWREPDDPVIVFQPKLMAAFGD